MDFTNKHILVTGASRGIGRVIAQQFAELGGRVVVHYARNVAAAEETLASLKGSGHIALAADLAQPEAAVQLVDKAVDQLGHIDILVNNAGVFYHHPVATTDLADWRESWQKILQINLVSVADLMYAAARHMMGRGGGKIINVSSRGAFRGEPDAPAYGASKAGMNALGQSLAKSLAPHNIFVYTVAPGFVETDMADRVLNSPAGDGIRQQSPLGRVAQPAEVARTVVFLGSEGIDFLTGCIVDVNGASYLRT